MTTKQILIALFISSIFSLTSCDDMFDDRIEGDENVTIKTGDISSFDELISEGKFEVFITKADSTSLVLEAEENLQAFIITEVHDHKLYIEEKDHYRLDNNKPMKIFVTTSNIDKITLTGSGNIDCDSIFAEYLDIEITGTGRIDLNNLMVEEINAEISGSGNIYVNATDYLIATITSSGDIYYEGNPDLNENVTGTGDVRRY